jgi:hypothetical protein
MIRKVKPPRVMWAVYSPGADGKLRFENANLDKQGAIDKAELGIGPWCGMAKDGWIVVKYVVTS